MKLVEFVPPEPHPLWKLCLQMGITDVIVKVMDHDPERVIADLAAAGLRVVGFEGDMFDMSPIKECGEQVKDGGEGEERRELAISRYCEYLELMAKHDIRLLCYNFMVGTGWARTGVREGRAGARRPRAGDGRRPPADGRLRTRLFHARTTFCKRLHQGIDKRSGIMLMRQFACQVTGQRCLFRTEARFDCGIFVFGEFAEGQDHLCGWNKLMFYFCFC